jgi:adenylate cyclase
VPDIVPFPRIVEPHPAPPQGVRTLVPIVHFDMVGYSRLIGADDAGTLARIKSLRSEVFDPLIARHGGAVAQTAGDSLLVLFGSILEAVRCAAAVQQRVPAHPANAQGGGHIMFRVGIEMGDVIADRGDFHGEGLIVAVRLESACPPGAICVSRGVYEHVACRIALTARPLGPLALKNVARKVEAFVLEIDPAAPLDPEPARAPDAAASFAAAFGDRAAIAVLPFRGYDGQDDKFVDALTDDLIDALSAWRSFPVIARHSTFAWRGRDIDVRVLGRELGARYIVSGAVRRRGAIVRVSVQVADCDTATTLLSDSYEQEGGAAQDEVVRAIAGVLGPEIMKLERERVAWRVTPRPAVYELFTRGMWHRYRNGREELERAEGFFRAALDIDPHYAPAMAALALCRNFALQNQWAPDPDAARMESLTLARQAVTDEPRLPHAHFALGVACMNTRRLPEAAAALREAIRLNPSHAYARANLGHISNYLNRPDEALAEIQTALTLNPHDPRRFMWLPYVACSHYLARRYKQALAASEEAMIANPEFPLAARYVLAALGQLGRIEEASAVIPLIRRSDGDLAGLEKLTRSLFVREAADHLIDGFRRAGFT